MTKEIRFLLSTFVFLTIAGCGLTDNEKPIPFYLELSTPTVKSPASPINDTHKITEVWVFADNQILGLFPLPAKVPVIYTENEVEITILPGIRNNGMNDTPVFYPFYQATIKKVKPEPNIEIKIPLAFEYKIEAKIPVNESFEDGNEFTIDIDANPQTFIAITEEDAILGSRCGVVTLNRENLKFVEVASNKVVNSGENARGESYIEFDYKGDGEIAVGLAKLRSGILNIEYFLFVPGKDSWNKIYVDVTDKLSANDYENYRLLLAFTKTGNSTESKVYIDNFKHVHF